MPQSATRGTDFRTFRTTIADVQAKTGLDFFWALPDALDNRVEGELGRYWLEALPGTKTPRDPGDAALAVADPLSPTRRIEWWLGTAAASFHDYTEDNLSPAKVKAYTT